MRPAKGTYSPSLVTGSKLAGKTSSLQTTDFSGIEGFFPAEIDSHLPS